jgi:hypothetical protein
MVGCDSGSSLYEQGVRRTWSRTSLPRATPRDAILAMIGNATLAASSRNTQPWKFRPPGSAVSIVPDLLDPIRDTPHFKEIEHKLNFPR